MADEQEVLESSVARLRDLVARLAPEQLRAQAYPSEWTVADALSHIGSGAEIFGNRVAEALGGSEVAVQPIWDAWNAKDPDAKAADALSADQALIERLRALTDAQREHFTVAMGPMTLGYPEFLRFRLAEHVLHTWDIAVVFDPGAGLAPDAVDAVLPILPTIARFSGKPTGSVTDVRIGTTAPERQFVVGLGIDGVTVAPDSGGAPELELPAEAFVRLVYGRLDRDHTPAFDGPEVTLDELRRAFPGV
jgi:uncharacterized protein (TIGR03083 family)